MKFLLDECLSPKIATLLSEAGHDAVHVGNYGMQSAEDPLILARAESENRVLVTADSDFPAILTLGRKTKPSCVVFRGEFSPAAAEQVRLLLNSLPHVEVHLERGALVVISQDRVRVRDLPINPEEPRTKG